MVNDSCYYFQIMISSSKITPQWMENSETTVDL